MRTFALPLLQSLAVALLLVAAPGAAALPIPFESNVGQLDSRVAFAARTFAGKTYVTRDGAIVHSLTSPGEAGGWSLVERFVGGRSTPRPGEPGTARVSAFMGSDRAHWFAEIPTWRSVRLGRPWPGIEVTLEAREANVEKLFTVEPGADASRIRVAVDGAQSLAIEPGGALAMRTGRGTVRFSAPVAWQHVNGTRRAVDVSYVLGGANRYGFRLGPHDRRAAVTIDPLLQSTYLGGSSPSDPARAIAIDAAGNVVVAGGTSSFDFPGTAGGAQPQPMGFNAYVARLSGDLRTLLQATYLGGFGSHLVTSLAIDAAGDVYVAGETSAKSFPATAGGAQAAPGSPDDPNGYDGFVVKLRGDLRSFVQATYLGGSGNDRVSAIRIAPGGEVVVAGSTASPDFPGAGAAAQSTDAFVARLAPDLRSLARSVLFGGSAVDRASALALDADGNVFTAGSTESADLPGTSGAAQATAAGGTDAFVARFDPSLRLVRATYFGGSASDSAVGLAMGRAQDLYVAGNTGSSDLPGRSGGAIPEGGGSPDAFVARLGTTLATLMQSTYAALGTSDSASALVLGASGSLYVAGTDQSAPNGRATVVRLGEDLRTLVATTSLGGSGSQSAEAIAANGDEIYLAGSTRSYDFPGTSGGAQPANNGGGDAFIARLTLPATGPTTRLEISGGPVARAGQSMPLTVRTFDAAGNPTVGARVRFTSTDASATLPPETLIQGPEGARVTAILRTLGSHAITVTDATNAALAASAPFDVRPGPAARLSIAAPAIATSGATFDFTVTPVDALGNATDLYYGTLVFTSTDPAATLPGEAAYGNRTFRAILRTTGSRTLTVTDKFTASITGTSAAIQVREPYRVTIAAPSTAVAGVAFEVTATVRDGAGNVVTSYGGTLRFTSSDPAATLPADSAPANGSGTFSVTLKTAGNHTLTATDTVDAATRGTSSAIAVGPAAAASLAIAAPPSAIPGGAFSFTVTARDAFGNVASGYGGTVRFSSSDAAATLPGDATLSQGTATLAATLRTLGDQTLTAADVATGALRATSPPIAVSLLAPSPARLDFGEQTMATTSPPRNVTFTNGTGGTITGATVTVSDPQFAASHDCATLAPGASCTAAVTFRPAASPGSLGTSVPVEATLRLDSPQARTEIALAGRAARSLVTHYYRSILKREPDAGGKAFWEAEGSRVAGLGAGASEISFAMARDFYGSAEYAARARDDDGFIGDLYETFFGRAPDPEGLAFWRGALQAGFPRENLLANFVFSSEFGAFTRAIFGDARARAEVDLTMDFYRGLLGRLPDDAGFAYWLGRFRVAQCAGATAVLQQADAVSALFAMSTEYAFRNRNASQYVSDLYNAFLRRGGEPVGVLFWIGTLTRTTTAPLTREQLRQEFRNSPEFQARVNAVASEGCLGGG